MAELHCPLGAILFLNLILEGSRKSITFNVGERRRFAVTLEIGESYRGKKLSFYLQVP